jgi:hypothetical protein
MAKCLMLISYLWRYGFQYISASPINILDEAPYESQKRFSSQFWARYQRLFLAGVQ